MPQFTIRRLSVPLLVLTLLSIVVPSATINSQAATLNAVSATTPCTKPGPCYDEPQLMGGAAPATVFNSRLAVQVGSDGRFNVGADPDPQTGGSVSGQSYDLAFAWPSSPWSSFTTVRIDGVNYTYGSSAGTFQTPPTAVDGRTISSVWQINDVDVTQTLQLVPNSQTGQEDVVKIAYTFANKGAQNRGD